MEEEDEEMPDMSIPYIRHGLLGLPMWGGQGARVPRFRAPRRIDDGAAPDDSPAAKRQRTE
jgi:hypothetical protein